MLGRLGEIRQGEISDTPSGFFKEVIWVMVRPASLFFTPGRLSNSENIV
jgi:hypothetical protein